MGFAERRTGHGIANLARAGLCALVFLLLPSPALAAPALVQTTSIANGGNGTSITATFASTPAAGNLLIAIAGNRTFSGVAALPTGWNVAIDESGNAPGQLILYKTAGSSESTAVTIDYTIQSRLGLQIYEYSGILNPALGEAVSNSGTNSPFNSGTVTTATNNELVIAGFVSNDSSSFTSWSNSFVERNDFINGGAPSSAGLYGGADRIAATPGNYSTTVTGPAETSWRGQIARFGPSGANCPGYLVTTTVDAGIGSLRECIKAANAAPGADTIALPAGTYVLSRAGGDDTATNGDLDITDSLTINGAGSGVTTVDPNFTDRAFDILSGNTVQVSGLKILNGVDSGKDGGGFRNAGTLTLTDVTISSCAGKNGGAISNTGTLTATNCIFSGNSPTDSGGGLVNAGSATLTNVTISGNNVTKSGGGIVNDPAATQLQLVRCTISGNTAAGGGGGIDNNGPATLTNVTISGNTGTNGGAFASVGGAITFVNVTVASNTGTAGAGGIRKGAVGTISLKNTIVANNTGGNCVGTITSLGNNLDSANTCAFAGAGDQINANPLLGALANNGGPTFTHALSVGSPAIDAGTAAGAPATDQRGIARPQGPAFDIGAYELVTYSIAGRIFEDVNYGGGAGRNWTTASGNAGSARPSARVELFNGSTGAFIKSSLTNSPNGDYALTGLTAGSYAVRVVSNSVTSSRAGYIASLLPVMTFRTNASSGTAVDVTDYVGGFDPATGDAGSAASGWNLDASTGVLSGGGSGKAHAFAPVTIGAANVNGVDFGFNFDTVVNKNDAGQGSFRQFAANANNLGGDAGLAQNGSRANSGVAEPLPAAKESSIFMITDGLAHPGLRAGLPSQLTAGVAVISATSGGFAFNLANGDGTIVDGTTQTVNVGNTNAGTLGTGGTVGVDAVALPAFQRPEVQIVDPASNIIGIALAVGNVTVRGIAIYGFDTTNIYVTSFSSGATVEQCVVGSSATSFANPGSTSVFNVGVNSGVSNIVVRNNLMGFATSNGILIDGSVSSCTIQGNELRSNAGSLEFETTVTACSATGNLIASGGGDGIQSDNDSGVGGTHTIQNNTISGCGGAGISISATGGATNNAHTMTKNIITANTGGGVVVTAGTGQSLTLNSIRANTGLGIDLGVPGVTPNDPGDVDTGANDLLNFPVITSASVLAGTVTARFNLDLPAGNYRIEFFKNPSGADPSGNGEGETFAGATNIVHPGGGSRAFTATFAGALGDILTSTTSVCTNGATCTLFGSTSEFSGSFTVTAPRADLALTKTDTPDPAPVGGELLYTLLVTNNGPDSATAAVVTDTLPAGVTLISATPSQGSCSGTTTVTCNLAGILSGGTVSIEILVVPSAAGTITNNAGITAAETDPVPGNNAGSASTTIVVGGTIDIPLTLYRRIHGFVDYTTTGGSLRTASNGSNACAVGASSTSALSGIPATATVTGAYLYWAGSGATADNVVTLDGASLTADRTVAAKYVTGGTTYDFFGGIKDVTAAVQAKRNGNYTFSGLTVNTGAPNCANQTVLAGWSLIVIYQDNTLSGKTLVLYDGFDITRNESSVYTLAGIFASAPPQAKSSFLLWEGDDTLSGANESLKFNGTSLSDAFNPVNNVYNGSINTLGVNNSWGTDLDTFDVSSLVAAKDRLATVTVSTDADMVILNAVVLEVKSNVITGTVFEDVNYSGGPGRDLAAAVAGAPGFTVPRPGATVELYDSGGNLLRTMPTGADGVYGFAGLIDGDYVVRVANGTVTSSRPGSIGGLWPVQTYRTDASSGTPAAVATEVGGSAPQSQDAGANVTNANLGSFLSQSKAPAKIVTGIAVNDVNFGYNFDTIVNTNNTGQGSLRQFLANANALQNANLAQSGLTAGVEHSLFMIPSNADPLGRAKDPGFDAARGVAVIAPTAALPALTDAATAIDGTTQTARIGDTNAGTLGTGGTVGTGADGIAGNADDLALPTVARPEIELRDGNNLPTGIDIAANGAVVRGIAIYGYGNGVFNDGFANVKVGSNGNGYTGTLIEQSVIGGSATSFADPGAVTRTDGDNVRVNGAVSGTIQNCLIGYATGTGVSLLYGSNGWTIRTSEIRGNSLGPDFADGIGSDNNNSGHRITANLIAGTRGNGIDLYNSAGSNIITDNTISANGLGANETAGVRVYGAGNSVARNIVTANFGPGVMVVPAATGNVVSKNSIFANGTIGIDLLTASDSLARGTAPYVTTNDSGDGDAGGNGLLNFPVITTARIAGPNLTVTGYARPGSTIEFFVSDSDPSGFGEGKTYLFTAVEGSGSDADASTGTYGPGAVNGIAQGTDTTNRFSFTVPVPPGVTSATVLTASATDGSGNTSEFGGAAAASVSSIVKRAFLLDGTPLANGVVVPRGTRMRFLLYIDNPGGAIADVSLADALDPGFAYIASSIRTSNTVAACAAAACTPAEEAAILAAANAAPAGSDAVDLDTVSFSGGAVRAGNQAVANAQLDIAGAKVFALVFTVRVQ